MKKIIFGLIIGFMLGLSATSFAAVGDRVEAVFKQFNIVINGEQVTLDTVPLVYNGTSYLPVRELANKLGYNVTYLADSETIQLTNKEGYEIMQITENTTVEELQQRLELVTRSLEMNEANLKRFLEKKQERIEKGHDVPEVSDYERDMEIIISNQKAEIADLKARLGITEETTQ